MICKWYYVQAILNEIGVIEYGKNTYCKAEKSGDELMDENAEYIICFSFQIIEKEKHYLSCSGFLKCTRIQHNPI